MSISQPHNKQEDTKRIFATQMDQPMGTLAVRRMRVPRRLRVIGLVICIALSLSYLAAASDPSSKPPEHEQEALDHANSNPTLSESTGNVVVTRLVRYDTAEDSQQQLEQQQKKQEPVVAAFEIVTSDYDGSITWENTRPAHVSSSATAAAAADPKKTPTREERQEFVERMQATLDTLLQRYEEQGTHVMEGEHQTIQELKLLIEEAAPLMTAELLQELPEIYEQFVDSQTITDDQQSIAKEPSGSEEEEEDDPAAHVSLDTSKRLISDMEPSEAFLDLEERILVEGVTRENMEALETLVELENDVFAREKLAFILFFEPNATQNRDFTHAFAHLRKAADAGLGVSSSLLALLSLIDFGVPRNGLLPRDVRRKVADDLLLDLAREQDFTASLVVAYRMFTGEMEGMWKGDPCQNAVKYYHRCAESNIHQLAEMGGERPYEFVRLSQEFSAATPGGGGYLNDQPLQEDAAQQFEYFRSLAGNPMDDQWAEATQRLGEMYFFGDEAAGVPQDYARATDHFRQAAEAGEPLAQANYGMMLAQGIGVQQDNETAFQFLQLSAAQGNGFAMHGLGVLYQTGAGVPKNETLAVEYFYKAVEFGYLEAHTFLGSAYLHGRGVARNETMAFDHFTEAATTESTQALYNLGVMYYRGAGATSRSCPKAVSYFRRVATHPVLLGDLPFSMEKAYDCVKKGDYVRGYLQYRLLAESGSEDAQANAAFLLEQFGDSIFAMSPSSMVVENEQKTELWMGEPKLPLVEAMALYKRAAALNDTEAIRKTGACHYEGWRGVCQQNATKAIAQYAKAAALGDPEAAYNCGAMYATGDGVARNLVTATRFFSMCSESSFPENVPCALALGVLKAAVSARGALQFAMAMAPRQVRSWLLPPAE